MFTKLFYLSLVVILLGGCNERNAQEEGKDLRPTERAYLQRLYPFGQADPEVYQKALKHIALMQAQTLQKRSIWSNLTWSFAGPTNIGGRVVDLEYNPQNPNIVYAASATGGLFKSTNGGNNWQAITDQLPIQTIGDLGVDPKNPENLYLGTGEANGGHNNFAGGGLYKSIDGGTSWVFKGLGQTASIGRVIVDHQNPQRIFVAAVGSYFHPNPDRGVYRSKNGGDSWEKILFVSDSTGVVDLVQHPTNPNILYASTWERVRRPDFNTHLFGPSSGIYRSTDGGDSWQRLGNGLPDSKQVNVGRIGLAISASSPNVLMALYSDGSSLSGLYKTENGGDTWASTGGMSTLSGVDGGFSWYFGQIRIHPTDPNVVFVMQVQCMRSADAGQTFTNVTGNMHVDFHSMAFHPQNPHQILTGNDGGIDVSSNNGLNWAPGGDLPITQFYEINYDPSNPLRLFGGTQDNGTIRTTTGGTSDWGSIYGGDGFYVIVHPTNPNIIYAESQNGGLGKSINGGSSFRSALTGVNSSDKRDWSMPVIMDPHNPEVLYLGTNRIYRTENGASNWTAVSPVLPRSSAASRMGAITTIAVSPTDRNVIYVGTDDGQVWVTNNYAETWTNISAGLPNRWVTRIAVDPGDATAAVVTFSGLKFYDPQPHVFRTLNSGVNWQNISSNLPDLPVNALAIDPLFPSNIFVGTDAGAFVTGNYGATWQPLGLGMPAMPVYDFKITPDRSFLIAGTHGRGMYKLPLSNSPAAREQETHPDKMTLLTLFPNPLRQQGTIEVRNPFPQLVRLDIFDVQGRRIRSISDTPLATGIHRFAFSVNDLPNGTYVIRLATPQKIVTRKMMIQR
ncbi:MAG: T9SS type A sorting domain-containing protein [Bacteroidetes Order II. Incertae sedis bacterium]|nr:T9SS type A sorting domain-containing protein [Bacteroidetes Order II. bacterium]